MLVRFLHSTAAAFLALVVSLIYQKAYASILVDFTESTGLLVTLSYDLAFCIGLFLVSIPIKFIPSNAIGDFILNTVGYVASIALVFVVFQSNDPSFKNEDAALFVDYYKAYVLPMVFFPLLAWFTLKPLFKR